MKKVKDLPQSPGPIFPNKEDKTLNNTNIEEVKSRISDVEVYGNGDLFQLLSKASSKSQGWMKSTKAMEIQPLGTGCVVQVTTQQGDQIAEAITFVPGVQIKENKNGKYLARK